MLVNYDGKSPIIDERYYCDLFLVVTELYPPGYDVKEAGVVRDEINILILTGNLDAEL